MPEHKAGDFLNDGQYLLTIMILCGILYVYYVCFQFALHYQVSE